MSVEFSGFLHRFKLAFPLLLFLSKNEVISFVFWHGDKLVGRFSYKFHDFFRQKSALPLYQHYPNPFLIKERQKRDNLFLKSFLWTSEQLVKLTFNICLCRFSWHVTQSKVSQKHANFRTFSSFSCISFELLSFLPSVSKTNVHKLSIPLHLKAIIKIFRSGFWDLWLAIQTCRRGVHATCKQWPWSLGL